jgi:hypothetical protein
MIKIRVFRAIDELESCQKFVEGHMKILKVFGITMITSANVDWFTDPYTYVIVAESTETGKVLGGARLKIAGGEQPLPLETALEDFDTNISEILKEHSQFGTAELCGLWNSREIAGMGIGSMFLTRTGVAIAPQLGLKSLWALCAPYTVEMAEKAGFKIATFLGKDGTFYYPKDDLLATVVVLLDTDSVDTADKTERDEIILLRKNPKQVKTEAGRKGKFFDLEYDLIINKK